MIIKQWQYGDAEEIDLDVPDSATCSGCVRCQNYDWGRDPGWHCQAFGKGKISPDDKHCEEYWDKELYEKSREEYEERQERERLARIEANKGKPPIKIGWGLEYDYVTDSGLPVPECPVCHEMPYSLEECYFCGTKFIQDDPELIAYKKDNGAEKDELSTCPCCGGTMHTISYMKNGGWRVAMGYCEGCGTRFIV